MPPTAAAAVAAAADIITIEARMNKKQLAALMESLGVAPSKKLGPLKFHQRHETNR